MAVPESIPVPMHSKAVAIAVVATGLHGAPKIGDIDKVANVHLFTQRQFPALVSLRSLAYTRLVIAFCIWTVILATMFGAGWMQGSNYRPGTKLINAEKKVFGWKTLLPFTSMAWIILGVFFTGSGWIAWQVDRDPNASIPMWLVRVTFISWELAAPFSLLVSTVVRYVIWTVVLRVRGTSKDILRNWKALMMHNANVAFALTETALLGGPPVIPAHLSYPVLFGAFYIILSWNITHIWNAPDKGPQYIYFFLDHTQPGWIPSLALVALLVALLAFYFVFSFSGSLLEKMAGDNLAVHFLYVLVISSLAMRFRD